MLRVLLSITLSFGITFFSIPVIITIAKIKTLFDLPNFRKIHTTQIASLGGIGIFAGFLISLLLTIPFSNAGEFQYYIASVLIIFFLGLKDDILIIAPIKKFIGQIFAASIVIFLGNLKLESMQGLLGVYHLSWQLSLLLTYLTILLIINAFNLIDGIDGLAGSLGLMSLTLLAAYFFKSHYPAYALLSFSLVGSLAAFLIFNFQPAKIFMGDTGSLIIGLINSILVIKFINIAPGNEALSINASPAIALSILLIPLLDTLRVFTFRLVKGRSPFSADKNHIHHILLSSGFSHRRTTLILLLVNISFIVLAYSFRSMGCTILFFLLTFLFFLGIKILEYSIERRRKMQGYDGKGVNIKDGCLILKRLEEGIM